MFLLQRVCISFYNKPVSIFLPAACDNFAFLDLNPEHVFVSLDYRYLLRCLDAEDWPSSFGEHHLHRSHLRKKIKYWNIKVMRQFLSLVIIISVTWKLMRVGWRIMVDTLRWLSDSGTKVNLHRIIAARLLLLHSVALHNGRTLHIFS